MSRSSEKKTRQFKLPKHLFLIIFMLGLVALLLQNNFQIFSYMKEIKRDESVSADSDGNDSLSVQNAAQNSPRAKRHAGAAAEKIEHAQPQVRSPMAPGRSDSLFSLTLAPVICTVLDKPRIRLSVTLKLFFSDDEVRREILLHRRGVAVIVKKVFSQTSFEDIVVDRMKPALLSEMNNLIAYGSIKDLTFEDLHPIH